MSDLDVEKLNKMLFVRFIFCIGTFERHNKWWFNRKIGIRFYL